VRSVSLKGFRVEVPKNIEENIKKMIYDDLDPSDMTSYTKSGAALFIGGALSLLLCGQFGMGLTPLAGSFSHTIHHGIGPLWCAAICGALFSIVPVFILRTLSRPLQFRALLRKKWQPQIIWTISIGTLLSYHGDFGFEFLAVVVWSMAAFVVFRSLGEVIDFGYTQVKTPHEVF